MPRSNIAAAFTISTQQPKRGFDPKGSHTPKLDKLPVRPLSKTSNIKKIKIKQHKEIQKNIKTTE